MTLDKDQAELAACALGIVATRWMEEAKGASATLARYYREGAQNARALKKQIEESPTVSA